MDQSQLESTCQGIQLAYNARKAGLEQHVREREDVASQIRDIRTNIQNAADEEMRQYLTRERNDHVSVLSEIDRKIATAQQQLQELENDYRFNQCDVFTGSLE